MRLAMLAGKLVTVSESFATIQDASDLYHNYYSNQLNFLVGSETGEQSAGIIAFVQAIRLNFLNLLEPIFMVAGIGTNDFKYDLKLFHEAEIVDL